VSLVGAGHPPGVPTLSPHPELVGACLPLGVVLPDDLGEQDALPAGHDRPAISRDTDKASPVIAVIVSPIASR
jgi:hypothetical protein